MLAYSLICTNRNVDPSRNVDRMPAFRPKWLPFLIDVCAQCMVKDDDHRIAVLTPATATGSVVPGAGPRRAAARASSRAARAPPAARGRDRPAGARPR